MVEASVNFCFVLHIFGRSVLKKVFQAPSRQLDEVIEQSYAIRKCCKGQTSGVMKKGIFSVSAPPPQYVMPPPSLVTEHVPLHSKSLFKNMNEGEGRDRRRGKGGGLKLAAMGASITTDSEEQANLDLAIDWLTGVTFCNLSTLAICRL